MAGEGVIVTVMTLVNKSLFLAMPHDPVVCGGGLGLYCCCVNPFWLGRELRIQCYVLLTHLASRGVDRSLKSDQSIVTLRDKQRRHSGSGRDVRLGLFKKKNTFCRGLTTLF